MPSQHEQRRIRRDALRNAEENLLQRALRGRGSVGRPKGSGRKPRTAPAQAPPLFGQSGRIWNVYVGQRYIGIVNEANNIAARHAAFRRWPFSTYLRAILATEDPWRRRSMIRPEFLLPLVTTRVQ